MDEVRIDPDATRRQAQALLDVVDEVRRVPLPEAAYAVAAAMPGSASCEQAIALAAAWAEELRNWVADATRACEAIDGCVREFEAVDERVATTLSRLAASW